MSLSRRVIVLLLGAFLALGMSLPVVQAASMPGNMTMTAGMGKAGHCKDCGDKGGMVKELGRCSNLGCAAPVLGVISQSSLTRLVHVAATIPQQDPFWFGRAFSPEPGPPRSHDIG
jgi:hypothetical protein